MIILLGLALTVMITTAIMCWIMLIIYGFKVLKDKLAIFGK
jgi:hypothetical protein|tara:strand:+ start:1760 stop:1882 length:123 start_codon:yes stop_codon:yes gene_type:complete